MGASRTLGYWMDGRSPSGGADKQKGGKGGYVLDSRRSVAETTVGYITNDGNKNNKKNKNRNKKIKNNKNDKYYSLPYYCIYRRSVAEHILLMIFFILINDYY
jgi:hypothetical protein